MKTEILITYLLTLLCSCSVVTSSKKSTVNHISESESTKYEQVKDTFICELKDVLWKDSSIVTFLSIKYVPKSSKSIAEIIPIGEKYYTYFGPVTVGNLNYDTCSIYSINTTAETGFFLLDDFNHLKDSLFVSIHGGTGYMDQNYMGPIQKIGIINHKELIYDLDSIMKISNKVHATKEWYAQWIKEHPFYQDQRTNPYNQSKCE